MELVCSAELSVYIRTIWHYIPEDGNIHNCCCGKIKSSQFLGRDVNNRINFHRRILIPCSACTSISLNKEEVQARGSVLNSCLTKCSFIPEDVNLHRVFARVLRKDGYTKSPGYMPRMLDEKMLQYLYLERQLNNQFCGGTRR
jgi:hypothetical protein